MARSSNEVERGSCADCQASASQHTSASRALRWVWVGECVVGVLLKKKNAEGSGPQAALLVM
jgi:hypothetical protein